MKRKLKEIDYILSLILLSQSIVGLLLGVLVLFSLVGMADYLYKYHEIVGIILFCLCCLTLFYSIYIIVKFKKQNK